MAGDARQLASRRGIALIRVSKARGRDDLISPELQATAIRTYAQRKSIRLIDTVEALDESGSQERSPWWETLETVVKRVEAGEAEVVVVWKFSRMARHRRRWAITIDRIEVAGAALESATEDVDASTSTGRFTRGMLAEMASWEAERIGEGWKEVKERRARLGLADGQPRFGYVLVDKTYQPDPIVGAALVECYRRAVAGTSMRALALWLNAQGHLTPKGNAWQPATLRETLRTGFAAGLIRYKGEHLPGVHEPLIDPALWEQFAAQQTPVGSGPRSRKHLFSGLLRCAYCNSLLYAYGKGAGVPAGTAYRCGSMDRRGTCPAGGVTAWTPTLRRNISTWISELVAGQEAAYEQRITEWRSRPKVNVTPLRRQLTRVETDLLTLAKKNLGGFYDDDTYLLLRGELLDRQRLLTKQIGEVAAAEPSPLDYRPLQRLWEDYLYDDEERRQALVQVLSHVLVRKAPDCPKYEPVPLWVDRV